MNMKQVKRNVLHAVSACVATLSVVGAVPVVAGQTGIAIQNRMSHGLGGDSSDRPQITGFTVGQPDAGDVPQQGYFVVSETGESRVYFNGRHVFSVLTGGGIFALRPHPGFDVDGWGGTLYLQPFFVDNLYGQAVAVSVTAEPSCVQVTANGSVPANGGSAGTWQVMFDLVCSGTTLSASGTYGIQLDNAPIVDLKFYKLASNYLRNVPVLGGGTADTGDMATVRYGASKLATGWEWSLNGAPAHFPNDSFTTLAVVCSGATNEVDTVRQGYAAIKLAYKPNLTVTLASQTGDSVCFGAMYDENRDKDFTADNIGITPWAHRDDLAVEYVFDLSFESEAVPGDRLMHEVSLTAVGEASLPWLGLLYSPLLTGDYFRIGSVSATAPGAFSGTVKSPGPGFFKVQEE